MNDERIKVKTENGQVLEVVVLNKRAEAIQIVLGEGPHSVKCDLRPTRNALAYVGSVMGREIVYERSKEQVQADIDRLNPYVRGGNSRR
jgi:K+/H+ antiporter YhaU regulatory subunit KhtT